MPLSGQVHTAVGIVTGVAPEPAHDKLAVAEAKVGSAVNTVAAVAEILCAISEKEFCQPNLELSEEEIAYRQRMKGDSHT